MTESLSNLVTLLADQPTPAHRNRFFVAFAEGNVAIPLPQAPPGTKDGGTYTVGPNDRLTVPETQGPDGTRWLLVYCDAASMQARNPGHVWGELAGRVILEVAQAHGLGIIVQNLVGPSPTWSGISKDDVLSILSGAYGRTGRSF